MTDLASDISFPVVRGFSNFETTINPFSSALSEFVFTRSYARWLPEKGRRERWEETVDRYMAFIAEERPQIPRHILKEIREGILAMDILPSMRALWSAGASARRDNLTLYNCSCVPLDCLKAFSELLYVLMMGAGIGYSVERQFVGKLPPVASLTGEVKHHVVPDSTAGWADSFYYGLTQWFAGNTVVFDYSRVRKAGAVLSTKGGRASGPEPLMRLFAFAEKTILGAAGRQLKSIEAHDIACMTGEIVQSGGVRRAALISISDFDDVEMRHAKDWSRGDFPKFRYMANNSAFYEHRPSKDVFWAEWKALRESGSGERGFSINSWGKRALRTGIIRPNPCGESSGRLTPSQDPYMGTGGSGFLCNLSAAIMRATDTKASFLKKVRLATWIGIIQCTFTHFPYLRPGWAETCIQDRLLGVDITGQCDNPRLSRDSEFLRECNQVAVETAAEGAAFFNINMPVAITVGKPSGNSSQMVDCASGFSARWSQYYIRRVRINATDPLFKLVRDAGLTVNKDNQFSHMSDEECPTWVVDFPMKSPKGAVLRNSESAIDQCKRYLQVVQNWCGKRGHNQSVTIYVKPEEWQEVGEWLWENFEDVTGISFLPFDGGAYLLAPYEEITAQEYALLMARMPHVAFDRLGEYEREDRGEGAIELACSGGACSLDDLYKGMEIESK